MTKQLTELRAAILMWQFVTGASVYVLAVTAAVQLIRAELKGAAFTILWATVIIVARDIVTTKLKQRDEGRP